jgi:lysophospholipase L1-like esterase
MTARISSKAPRLAQVTRLVYGSAMVRPMKLVAVLAVAVLGCSNSGKPAVTAGGGNGGAGGAQGGGGSPHGGGGTTTNKPAWDWVGIVGTGQSLSVGANGTPLTQTSQPYDNLELDLGTATVPPYDPASTQLSVVPLVEPIRRLANSYPSAYPRNVYGETPHTAMANEITALFKAAGGLDYVTVHTVVGESGQGMDVIDKSATDTGTTGHAYAATLFEASALTRLAKAAGKTYGIGAIVITHGETDTGNATYGNALYRLQQDYNTDLKALTGQTATIPMFVSQQHSTPSGAGTRSASTLAQWRVGIDHPGDLVCSGPKYQYPYSSDGVHLVAKGYDELGEKYAEVYNERVVLGHDWQPLQPTGITKSGRVVTVTFHVPAPPLVWDDAMPAPHQTANTAWASGRGFEVVSGTTAIAIDSVAISGDTVAINCSTDLPSGAITVRYASTSDGVMMPNGTWRWGHLRDSDPLVGATTKAALPNYCVAFEMSVP